MTNFPPSKGFTLIELMVVTALVSILLGIGSAFLSNSERQLALKMGTLHASSVLQSAKAVSIQENTSSKVNIFSKENTFQVWTGKLAGCWHLEDISGTGAFSIQAKIQNCLPKEGKVGKSMYFQPGTSKITLGNWGLFSLEDGFILSFWVYPERIKEGQEQILWEIPGHYILGISQDYTLFLKRGKTNLSPQEIRLPIYQWSLIEITQELSEISLSVDNIIRFQKSYDNQKNRIPPTALLNIGNFFHGKIDEIKLLRRAIHLEWTLPAELEIRKSPQFILFNSQGVPDPLLHSGGVVLVLGKWETTQESTIFVMETGQIRIQQ